MAGPDDLGSDYHRGAVRRDSAVNLLDEVRQSLIERRSLHHSIQELLARGTETKALVVVLGIFAPLDLLREDLPQMFAELPRLIRHELRGLMMKGDQSP